jgi:succinate dehydrogenase / fumarate reductase, cytochrome b subunit
MTTQTHPDRAFALPVPGPSVARKVVVSLSGLFLILFLVVHLSVNLTMFGGADTYNTVAHWMGTNPFILAMRPLLVLGFLAHIVISALLWTGNLRARPTRYATVDPAGGSTWASRNMLVLGALVILFLALHLSSFSIKLTFGAPPYTEIAGAKVKDVYGLVTARFALWWYVSLYVVAIVMLGLHLSHGVQSAIQTLGLSDARWRRRWTCLGNIYAIVVAVGFASLPVFHFIQARVSSAP